LRGEIALLAAIGPGNAPLISAAALETDYGGPGTACQSCTSGWEAGEHTERRSLSLSHRSNGYGGKDPHAGLEGKFSIYHATAVALVTGRAGEQAFMDQAVSNPTIVAMRKKVAVKPDPTIKADQADMMVTLTEAERCTSSWECPDGVDAPPYGIGVPQYGFVRTCRKGAARDEYYHDRPGYRQVRFPCSRR
jgi:hypothetical protein